MVDENIFDVGKCSTAALTFSDFEKVLAENNTHTASDGKFKWTSK